MMTLSDEQLRAIEERWKPMEEPIDFTVTDGNITVFMVSQDIHSLLDEVRTLREERDYWKRLNLEDELPLFDRFVEERDTARAEVRTLREEYDDAIAQWTEAEKERDALREERERLREGLERIADLPDSITATSDDGTSWSPISEARDIARSLLKNRWTPEEK